jgi:chromosome segregation ATPase
MANSFDELTKGVSFAGLERELESDRRRYRAMRDRYEDLRQELEQLGAMIERRERILEAYQDSELHAPGAETSTRLTKPEIARRVLWASVEPLYPRQVREIAVDRGWLRDDQASHNQLAVAMSKMVRKGRLVKGDDGRYRLPPRS